MNQTHQQKQEFKNFSNPFFFNTHTMESNFNTTSEYNSSNDDKFQSVVRRKLERFRTKLSELLFTVNNASPNHIVNSTHTSSQFSSIVHSPNSQQQQQQMSTDDANSSMLISNYYYGYTSPISEEDLRLSYNKSNKKSKNFHQITSHTSSSSSSSSSSSACSSSSSMIIDDDDTNSNLSSYHSQPQTGKSIQPREYRKFATDMPGGIQFLAQT